MLVTVACLRNLPSLSRAAAWYAEEWLSCLPRPPLPLSPWLTGSIFLNYLDPVHPGRHLSSILSELGLGSAEGGSLVQTMFTASLVFRLAHSRLASAIAAPRFPSPRRRAPSEAPRRSAASRTTYAFLRLARAPLIGIGVGEASTARRHVRADRLLSTSFPNATAASARSRPSTRHPHRVGRSYVLGAQTRRTTGA